jgi:hypothetical protein
MRMLLATAVVIFAVTAAQAQSAGPSADDQAVQNLVEKLKASRAVKTDAKPAELAPAEAKSVEAAPAKPAETKPVEIKPAPTEAKPVEANPVEGKTVDSKTVEPKSVGSKPVQAATRPEKKPVVVKNRETHEQSARRLAEKYGFGGLDLE